MDEALNPERVAFRAVRPATRKWIVAGSLIGVAAWLAAGWIVLDLVEHTYIVRQLLLVAAASCLLSAVGLSFGIVMRRRQERGEPPKPAGRNPDPTAADRTRAGAAT
jgi:hypothetical protein